MTRDLWSDTETYCERPLKDGSHQYAQDAEVMLWSYALDDGDVKVWDRVNKRVWWQEELSGNWESAPCASMPVDLAAAIDDDDFVVWFQNGGQFDFPVLRKAMPDTLGRIRMKRWRDTMVQAFSHALPGALEKLGAALNLNEDDRKIREGKKLVHLFCKPQSDAFEKKFGTRRATAQTHPLEWVRFIKYAGGDITTMRAAHRIMPSWNYKPGKQMDMWHCDLRMNMRGFAVDVEFAKACVEIAERVQAKLADQVQVATEQEVQSANQRDALLAYILAAYDVELPNMQADTLERALQDDNLPFEVKELINIRLMASKNSVSKFKTLLRGVSRDGRLRGCSQFRGAGRTGRWAHRLFQPGNLPRQTIKNYELLEWAIDRIMERDLDALELVFPNVMEVLANLIRGAIIAPDGKKLIVVDLSNIEGRVAAWLAGEEWKLQAFRDYDTLLVDDDGEPLNDEKGKRLRKGLDLYVKAYMASFNVTDPALVGKDERQIGKVEELMFQYGGGVGAWLTGAATYGIDLDKMTEQVYDVVPEWAKAEAEDFLQWLYEQGTKKLRNRLQQLDDKVTGGEVHPEEIEAEWNDLTAKLEAAKLKKRFGLPERTFVCCDAIKRLWRKAHPKIASYWKEIEETVKQAIRNPGTTYDCRRVKVRRDGAWLRCGLPSGRALCYPNPRITEDGKIVYTGLNQYTRKWGDVYTYGGKFFENWTQAVACDQFAEPMIEMEDEGYEEVLGVHDEWVCEVPDEPDYTVDRVIALMTKDLDWNAGLPLSAAGFETYRYRKGD